MEVPLVVDVPVGEYLYYRNTIIKYFPDADLKTANQLTDIFFAIFYRDVNEKENPKMDEFYYSFVSGKIRSFIDEARKNGTVGNAPKAFEYIRMYYLSIENMRQEITERRLVETYKRLLDYFARNSIIKDNRLDRAALQKALRTSRTRKEIKKYLTDIGEELRKIATAIASKHGVSSIKNIPRSEEEMKKMIQSIFKQIERKTGRKLTKELSMILESPTVETLRTIANSLPKNVSAELEKIAEIISRFSKDVSQLDRDIDNLIKGLASLKERIEIFVKNIEHKADVPEKLKKRVKYHAQDIIGEINKAINKLKLRLPPTEELENIRYSLNAGDRNALAMASLLATGKNVEETMKRLEEMGYDVYPDDIDLTIETVKREANALREAGFDLEETTWVDPVSPSIRSKEIPIVYQAKKIIELLKADKLEEIFDTIKIGAIVDLVMIEKKEDPQQLTEITIDMKVLDERLDILITAMKAMGLLKSYGLSPAEIMYVAKKLKNVKNFKLLLNLLKSMKEGIQTREFRLEVGRTRKISHAFKWQLISKPLRVLRYGRYSGLEYAPVKRKGVIIVLDRSGSMSGEPLVLAQSIILLLAKYLDMVVVIPVDVSTHEPIFIMKGQGRKAWETALDEAVSIAAAGGTDIWEGYEEACKIADEKRLRNIIIMSDLISPFEAEGRARALKKGCQLITIETAETESDIVSAKNYEAYKVLKSISDHFLVARKGDEKVVLQKLGRIEFE